MTQQKIDFIEKHINTSPFSDFKWAVRILMCVNNVQPPTLVGTTNDIQNAFIVCYDEMNEKPNEDYVIYLQCWNTKREFVTYWKNRQLLYCSEGEYTGKL